MKFEILMKPTAMSRNKAGKARLPEYTTIIDASDKNAAVMFARNAAAIEGFAGYAITKIKELRA